MHAGRYRFSTSPRSNCGCRKWAYRLAGRTTRSAGVGVEPVRGAGVIWAVDLGQDLLQRVAIEPSTRVHRQRSGLVEHEDRLVLIQHADVGVDVRLTRAGVDMYIPLTAAHDVFMRSCNRGDGGVFPRSSLATHAPLGTGSEPGLARNMPSSPQSVSISVRPSYWAGMFRAMVLVAATAGQRIRDAGNCSLQLSDPLSAGHLRGHKAVRAGDPLDEARVLTIFRSQGRLTGVALGRLSFFEVWIETDPLVKDKTLPS